MAGKPRKRIKAKTEAQLFSEPEFWTKLFYVMSQGESVTRAIKHFGVTYHKVLAQINHDPELKKEYEAAQVARALYHVDKIEEIAEGKADGNHFDTHGAKIALDARKWVAAKLDPNRWGDRSRVDITTTDINKLHLEAIQALGKEETEILVNPQQENLAIEYDR